MTDKAKLSIDEMLLTELEKKPLYQLYRFLRLDLKQTLTVDASPHTCAEHLKRIENKFYHLELDIQQIETIYQFDLMIATANKQGRRHVIGAIHPSATSDMSLITLRIYPSGGLFFFACFVAQLVVLQVLSMLAAGKMGSATLPVCITFMVLFIWFMGYQEKRAALTVISNHLALLNGEQQPTS